MKLERIESLTPEIERSLAGVSDPLLQFQGIIKDIQSGAVQLYKLENGSLLAICQENSDLLVVAYVGMDAYVAAEISIDIARHASLKYVRFHTARKGLARLIKSFKPELIQQVYRIPI